MKKHLLLGIIIFFYSINVWALNPELLQLDLEQLLEIEVTSPSKHRQKIADVASAVYVLTSKDITQGFDFKIPELLRDVPGVHVARITSSDWAISIRGFNDRFANKLLVMMDGRTLYTPLFSGVFWERQDYILEDLKRIEVIRGPGASVWGANAVNGVINILTKNAWETQGLLTKITVGDEESLFAFRYGNHYQNLAYRIYLKGREIDSLKDSKGRNTHDDWRTLQGGFRIDVNLKNNKYFRLSGDILSLTAGVLQSKIIDSPPYEIFTPDDGYGFGADLLAKLEKRDDNSGWYLQAYYDTSLNTGFPLLNWNLDIYDIEFKQDLERKFSHWTWGLGYRLYVTDVKGTSFYWYDPAKTKTYIFNAFVQEEIRLNKNKQFIWGSKFEYHEDTGFNIQPTVRFLWHFKPKVTLWAAVSKAVRVPSKGELDTVINLLIPQNTSRPLLLRLTGNKDLDPEKLIAFEFGLRSNFKKYFTLDTTAFFNLYDDLIGLPVPKNPPVFIPSKGFLYNETKASNFMDGESYGLELSLQALFDRLTLKLNYSYLKLFLHSDRPSLWLGEELEKQWPRHILSIIGRYNIRKKLRIDTRLRYVSKLPSYKVPSYLTTDISINWLVSKNSNLSLVIQNIFDPRHPEFGQAYALRTPMREVERCFWLKFVWNK